ncbi:MAG: CsgG/HfaB family protein [Candidatus Marinimicrobia bacterium]|nr:CsgG/HfaB family protein [Candidatus Neomarinimicrobiota bacterium]
MSFRHFIISTILLFSTVLCKDSAINLEIRELSRELSNSYQEKVNPAFKHNIAILDLENLSQTANQEKIGQSVSELLRTYFSESLIFNTIEREKIDKILEEQKLQLSGLTDESKAVSFGEMLNANVLLLGSVSELGAVFNINTRLVSVATGEILIARKITLNKDELIERAQQLQMEYVERMGIGIGLKLFGVQQIGNEWEGFVAAFQDKEESKVEDLCERDKDGASWLLQPIALQLDYRFSKHWLASSTFGLFFANYHTASQFGSYDYNDSFDEYGPIHRQLYFETDGSGFDLALNLFYVYLVNQNFNINIGGGISGGVINYEKQLFYIDNITDGDPSNNPDYFHGQGRLISDGEIPDEDSDDFLGYQGLINFQYFITPRLALNISGGYFWGKTDKLKTEDMEAPYPEWWSGNQENIQIENTNLQDIDIELTGWRIDCITISMYF